MKLKDILKDIEPVELNADLEADIGGISYDSRNTRKGDVFVAISGFAVDGHKFIPKALENGASVVICERRPEENIPYVLVKDSRTALALMSRNYFRDPASEMTVIGVTGTNGKTTTTYLLKHLLEAKLDAKVGLVGTNGNMIGDEFLHTERTTPESYELQKLFREMADAGCTHVVMEVSSHSLVLSRVAGISFEVAVFTNLTQDHLDFHGTMAEYAKAKARLFNMCRTGCLNVDDKWHETMCENVGCKWINYSASGKAAELCAANISLSAGGVEFDADYNNEREHVKLSIPGTFSVYNALSVISAGLALGVTLHDCAEALSDAKGVKGRMEVVPTDGDYTMLIDYAHTPDALENALLALKAVSHGRLVVLFGCGGDRDRTKRPIMGGIAGRLADFAVVTSDNPRTEEPMAIINEIEEGLRGREEKYTVICDRVEAIKWVIDNHMPDDVILLAGKGHEDYQIVGHEKHHMDEREIVADHINEKRKEK